MQLNRIKRMRVIIIIIIITMLSDSIIKKIISIVGFAKKKKIKNIYTAYRF